VRIASVSLCSLAGTLGIQIRRQYGARNPEDEIAKVPGFVQRVVGMSHNDRIVWDRIAWQASFRPA